MKSKKQIILPRRRGRPSLTPDKTCSVEGCHERVIAKGLCKKHYFRKWRQAPRNDRPGTSKLGRPRGFRAAPKLCALEGCERIVVAKGLCTTHYQRMRRSQMRAEGKIKPGRRGRRRDAGGELMPCTIEGCERKVLAKGLCSTHYQQRWSREIWAPNSRKVSQPEPKLVIEPPAERPQNLSRPAVQRELKKTCGGRIRLLRGNLTQMEFAAQLGIWGSRLQSYEKNLAVPPTEILYRIAQVGGKSMEWIMTGEEDGGLPRRASFRPKSDHPLSREELIAQAARVLSCLPYPETGEFIALMKEVVGNRERMAKVLRYYRFLAQEGEAG